MEKNQYYQFQAGFTYTELLVVMTIVIFILIAALNLFRFTFSQQTEAINSYVTVENANRAIETMLKEIRNSRNGENGAYVFVGMLDQELIFYSNEDQDDDVERIRYFLDEGVLKKGIIQPTGFPATYLTGNEITTDVTEYVRNDTDPVFYYYNGDWPTDTTNNPLSANRLLDTRLIEIHLLLNSNPEVLDNDYEVRSQTQIRMMKDNL